MGRETSQRGQGGGHEKKEKHTREKKEDKQDTPFLMMDSRSRSFQFDCSVAERESSAQQSNERREGNRRQKNLLTLIGPGQSLGIQALQIRRFLRHTKWGEVTQVHSSLETRTHKKTHTHARTHTHTRARTHTHHTHTYTHTHITRRKRESERKRQKNKRKEREGREKDERKRECVFV